MKTYVPGRNTVWSLANGREISEDCAKALIRNGWVKPQRDGLELLDETQTYTAIKPGGN